MDAKKAREYFDGYAIEKGLDPLDPSSWYSLEKGKGRQKEVLSTLILTSPSTNFHFYL